MSDEENLREGMPEPWPGAVVMLESPAGPLGIPVFYQHKPPGGGVSRHQWQCPGSHGIHTWQDIQRYARNRSRKLTVLYAGTQPEPPYDSHVLTIGAYGSIATYWHGEDGWHIAGGTGRPIEWSEVIDTTERVIVLAEKRTLKVDL